MFNFDVIYSILRRNVQSYFSGVLGYLVIVVFVTVAAFCAFSPKFFAYNLANLDQLSEFFPILLLALVPAMTMSTWADERKLGTDELLFTLPATDMEVLLGKYLSVLSVYTIAIGFSLTQLIVLAWIGDPDWGVVFTTYVGFWLAGAALLSAGMFASVLTGSTTVAYVLGATICSVPIFIGTVAPGSALIQSLSLSSQLRDFSAGMIPLTGVLYFVGLTVFMLYLNMVAITSRHWHRGEEATMSFHFIVRAAGLAATLISVSFIAEKSSAFFPSRLDLTSEGLYTLSDTTQQTLDTAAEKKRSVTIQAFISPEVPQEYVYARKQLIGLLNQYDRIGGNTVDLRLVDVEPNSDGAKEARTLGIEPQLVQSELAGKQIEQDVYLGVVITSNVGEEVLPFVDGVTSMEYELTRALATVTARQERIKVGILATDGLRLDDDPTRPTVRPFFSSILTQMEEQYRLIDVSYDRLAELIAMESSAAANSDDAGDDDAEDDADADIPEVLIVVQPTSLTTTAMTNLDIYIRQGKPVILLADPVPFYPYTFYRPEDIGVTNSPRQQRPSPDSGLAWISSAPTIPVPPHLQQQLMQMQQQLAQLPPQFAQQMIQEFYRDNPDAQPRYEPKGQFSSILNTIGVEWNDGRVVWDVYNPNPEFSPYYPREILGSTWPRSYGNRDNLVLYAGEGSGSPQAFSNDDPISAGIQELMFFYSGTIRDAVDSDLTFRPLVQTGPTSGLISWDELTYEENVSSLQEDPRTGRVTRVQGVRECPYTGLPLVRLKQRPEQETDDQVHTIAAHITSSGDSGPKINVVFVADFDFISDMYYEQINEMERKPDNETFLFNAVEVLAGDESLVELRNRRASPRRLLAIQGEIDRFRLERSREQQKAEAEIRNQLTQAREDLRRRQQEIDENTDLGFVQRFGQLGEAADVAEQEFALQRTSLEEDLERTIDDLKANEQSRRDALESRVRFSAVVLPPIPALLMGLVVLMVRLVNEKNRVAASRRKH